MLPLKKNSSQEPWKALLHNTQFRWLFGGNTALFMAFNAGVLMRSLLAWQLTHDEMSLAYINLTVAIGIFCTSIFSGTIIDRSEKRRLMLIAQSVILIAESAILFLLATQQLKFEWLLLNSIVASLAFPFIMPARTAMIVEATSRSSLGKATAIMSGGVNVARMVSPAIVGIVADLTNNLYAYSILVFLHLSSFLCIFFLTRCWPTKKSKESFLREIKVGFTYIRDHRSLALCMIFGVLPILVVVPLQNLLVVFVEQVWTQGGSGLGILMTAMGIGGLVGSVLMGLSKEGNLVKPMIISTLGLCFFILLFSHSPFFWLAVALIICIYSCSVLGQTLVHTAIQLMTDDHVRGRVTTITLMSYGLAPMGTIPLALATRQFGAPWAMTIGALILMAATLYIWFRVPSFRQIDKAAEV